MAVAPVAVSVDDRPVAPSAGTHALVYEPLPRLRAAYSDRAAALMAQMCRLAYLRFEQSADQRRALEDALAEADFVLLETYPRIPLDEAAASADTAEKRAEATQRAEAAKATHGVECFLAAHKYGHLAVLAFRGTTNALDWRINFQVERKEILVGAPADSNGDRSLSPHSRTVRVHSGFYDAYQAVHDEIARDMTAFWADYPRTPVFITGHSLGGALAQIATAHLTSDQVAACYTFGAPRVGEKRFDQVVKSPLYRVCNGFDIVPSIPLRIMGYSHSGDVRTMSVREPMTLNRRDLGTISSILRDLWGLLISIPRQRLAGMDDHSVNLYADRLLAHAQRRRGLTQIAADRWR